MDHCHLINFVAACSNDEDVTDRKQHDSSITGEEAKHFYENLFNNDLPSINTVNNELQTTSDISNFNGESYSSVYASNLQAKGRNCVLTKLKLRSSNLSDCSNLAAIKSETLKTTAVVDSNSLILPDSESLTSVTRDMTYFRKHQKMLGHAQNGDIDVLKKLFMHDLDVDIDFQDQYGWTALMCAAVARQLDIVNILLSKGANKYILNFKDKNVLELCEEVGAIDAKIIINSYHDGLEEKTVTQPKPELFYCNICMAKFQNSTFKQHSTSTVHLFNLKLKPKADQFMMTENNKGFQLMKKSGWDGEKGLGPEGLGHRYPVKTYLKRDRRCLGTGHRTKAKVTHFGPNDTKAVTSVHQTSQRIMSTKTISKQQRKLKDQKERQWEKNLRMYMNIDL